MPLDALAQAKGQPGAVVAPGPIGRQIGHDRLKAGLLHALVEEHQIVEHAHHRPDGKGGGFFEDGHAGRAVGRVDLQGAPGLLRQDGARGSHAAQKPNN